MKEELALNTSHHLALEKVERMVDINGVKFDETFLAGLVRDHLAKQVNGRLPTITDAFEIYIRENASAHRPRFVKTASRHLPFSNNCMAI